jgi:hypothetical protein
MRKRKPAPVPPELVAIAAQLAAVIGTAERRIDALVERLRKKECEQCEPTKPAST